MLEQNKQSLWFFYGAFLPETLSVVLTILWAWNAQDIMLIKFVFVAAFIGFVIFKAYSVPVCVTAYQRKYWQIFIFSFILALGSVFTLFFSSLFELANHSGIEIQQAIENDKNLMALDEQISLAKTRMNNMSSYSDNGKVMAEIKEIENLNNEIANLSKKLLDCPKLWYKNCINPIKTKIAELNAQKNSFSYGSNYLQYQKNAENYNNLLAERRQITSSNSNIIHNAYRPEDRIIASLFGINPETANWLKWLFFALFFDLASLIARIVSSLLENIIKPENMKKEETLRTIDAMLTLGIDPIKTDFNKQDDSPVVAKKQGKSESSVGFGFVPNQKSNAKKQSIKNCINCNTLFHARHKNHIRCPQCGAEASNKFKGDRGIKS